MAATNINRVVLTGNLTADPELRSLPSGTSVCKLRVACNTRRKNGSTGEWEDKPNYFNVTVWGAQGENAARYLSKGRPVAIDGRLEWREWEAQDGTKRQAIDIIADSVQFLGSREDGSGGGGVRGQRGLQGQRRPGRRRGFPARTGRRRSRRRRHSVLAVSEVSCFQTSQPDARTAAVQLMAKARGRGKPVRRRDKKGGPGSGRRKPCQHCRDKVEQVDYKDVASLRKFISEKGKIRSRRITGSCRRHQVADRTRRQARPRAGAAALRERGRPRRQPPAANAATGTASGQASTMPEAILLQDVEHARRAGHGRRRLQGLPAQLPDPAQARPAGDEGRDRSRPPAPGSAERAGRAKRVEKAQENVNLLNRTVLTIPQQAGADGRLFGSVTAQDIATAIREARGLRIDKQQRAPAGADQERRHLHGRRGGRRRRDRHDQDHGRRQES